MQAFSVQAFSVRLSSPNHPQKPVAWLLLLAFLLNLMPLTPVAAGSAHELICIQTEITGIQVTSAGYVRLASGRLRFPLTLLNATGRPLHALLLTGQVHWQEVVRAADGLPAPVTVTRSAGGMLEELNIQPADPASGRLTLLLEGEFNPARPLLLTLVTPNGSSRLMLNFAHPRCDQSAAAVPLPDELPPPALIANAWLPDHHSHVILANDFLTPWSPADESEAIALGWPIAATATALVKLPDSFWTTNILPAATPEGWQRIHEQLFDVTLHPDMPSACQQFTLSTLPTLHPVRKIGVGSGVGGGALGLTVTTGAGAPVTWQWLCRLRSAAGVRNLLLDLGFRLPAAPGLSLFAGVSTDEQIFYGRRWQSSAIPATPDPSAFPTGAGSAPDTAMPLPAAWQRNLLFFPDWAAGSAQPEHPVTLLLEVRAERPDLLAGLAIDDLRVERFVPPAAGCRRLDPAVDLPNDAPGRTVSKGLNVPPYLMQTPLGLDGHLQRLSGLGVNWVRLELQAPLPAAIDGAALSGAAGLLTYVDLQYYDRLLYALCHAERPMAVLGLIDYATVRDHSWRADGKVSGALATGFAAQAQALATYFGDRIGVWEIWNEPDFSANYLRPEEYHTLLAASYAAIKQRDPSVQVLFGGLGSADRVALSYLRRFVAAGLGTPAPFDIFALHPYPSQEFRRAGALIRDAGYLQAVTPSVLAPFLELLQESGKAGIPIWITELGANRAGDSRDPATQSCVRVYETMVGEQEQAIFLYQAYETLVRGVHWPDGTPAVDKIFWYQYYDVGLAVPETECLIQPAAAGPGASRIVDWWYGLYSGTDPAQGVTEPSPHLAACVFQAWPDTVRVAGCFPAP